MRIAALSAKLCLGQNDWSSCRYTKGEGFDLLDNTSGVFVEYIKIFSDTPDHLLSCGVEVLASAKIQKISRPELDYIIDMDAFDLDSLCENEPKTFSPSLYEAKAFLKAHPSLQGFKAEDQMDESFHLVSYIIRLEPYMDSCL